MTMPSRHIGPLTVSAVGFGCMNMSHGYRDPAPEDHNIRLLNHALDLGYTFLDTAAIYGNGGNERLIGKAVMHRRKEFTLASKCVLAVKDGERVVDGSPGTIAETLDGALERLGTDHIDLYYLHRLDPKVPIEDSVGALARAKEAGKIGALGLSEMSAATIRRAHAVHPIAAIQTEYSPWVRNPEIAVLDTCRELDIGFVAFSPVGRGFFGGVGSEGGFAGSDMRLFLPRFMKDNLDHNLTLYERFQTLAADVGCTPAQLAIAWVLTRGKDIVPIPGTTNFTHLEENADAAAITLSDDVLAEVDRIFTPGAVRGNRYPPSMQAMVDTEMFPEEQSA